MWGTSSPDDKLTGDLGNVIEATQICGRRSDRLMARKLSSSNFGLLQQYLPKADSCTAVKSISIRSPRRHTNIGPIVHQFCALSRASIIFFASATIASLGLFSSVAGLSGSADDEPGGKIIALQPFPTGLTSRRYPL